MVASALRFGRGVYVYAYAAVGQTDFKYIDYMSMCLCEWTLCLVTAYIVCNCVVGTAPAYLQEL